MRFARTAIDGVLIVEADASVDVRGSFARTFDAQRFAEFGLVDRFDQQSVASNTTAGTLRGLHYQIGAHAETKLVRCTRGALFDVAVDLRRSSPTFGTWVGVELDARGRRALYIPRGCAHGYLTTEADTEALYLIAGPYTPDAARGINYLDPTLQIAWPRSVACISGRDAALPTLERAELPDPV
jgi:dTDP-4-dehydrorhamnose 3,5-epimerase